MQHKNTKNKSIEAKLAIVDGLFSSPVICRHFITIVTSTTHTTASKQASLVVVRCFLVTLTFI